MNKDFFKIDHKITLLDILKVLNISEDDLSFENNYVLFPENIYIEDFVSFENLKKNKLSFFTNVKSNFNHVTSGICIVEKENFKFLNKSFQRIQKNFKDLLAQIIKDVSINKNINVVLLKENVFLFNNQSIDFTNEVLELFNNKTKSMKIIINSPK